MLSAAGLSFCAKGCSSQGAFGTDGDQPGDLFQDALFADQVTIAFVDPPPAIGMLKSGKIRGLAVTGAKRHAFWPEIPTMAEAGIKAD